MIALDNEKRNVAARLDNVHREAVQRLASAGVADAARDARVLLRWAMGVSPAEFAATPSDAWLSAAQRATFEAAIARRAERRPVSQIVGGREFFGRWFEIDETVLDPRPESEALVSAALRHAPSNAPVSVLDLGVGSGCLLLSVLAERVLGIGLGVDVSAAAIATAACNAERLGLADRARFVVGDWLSGVEETFDLVLCNPPYIAADALARLSPEVRLWEPTIALTPGADALIVYRLLAPQIKRVLKPGGAAFFEVGLGQAADVSALFLSAGAIVEILPDLGGAERVVVMRY